MHVRWRKEKENLRWALIEAPDVEGVSIGRKEIAVVLLELDKERRKRKVGGRVELVGRGSRWGAKIKKK